MSWSKETTLWCDGEGRNGEGCQVWVGNDSRTVGELESDLVQNGDWVKVEPGKHLCPDCAEEVEN